jgi:hypothetical protein
MMRRLIAVAAVAVLATFGVLLSPSSAMQPQARPAVGTPLLQPVNGRAGPRGHYRAYGHARRAGAGFVTNGFALMYRVHSYPRGISATFGSPRYDCHCQHRF